MQGVAQEADVRIGLSICFDLRFPELYREMTAAGAVVLAVPANFTEATGRDHWEVLLRARAIENGAFVVAPAQCGIGGGVPTHGRSMIVDPWGTVIAQAPDGPGVVVADLEMERVVPGEAATPDAAGALRIAGAAPRAPRAAPPAPFADYRRGRLRRRPTFAAAAIRLVPLGLGPFARRHGRLVEQ